jgi:hypothetical protein
MNKRELADIIALIKRKVDYFLVPQDFLMIYIGTEKVRASEIYKILSGEKYPDENRIGELFDVHKNAQEIIPILMGYMPSESFFTHNVEIDSSSLEEFIAMVLTTNKGQKVYSKMKISISTPDGEILFETKHYGVLATLQDPQGRLRDFNKYYLFRRKPPRDLTTFFTEAIES